jgi:4-deoxy-L-threo-5-hexosulose-uronate ketol-isomerase
MYGWLLSAIHIYDKLISGGRTMDIRYSANQRDVRRYTTEELRKEFHITNLYQPDKVTSVYSHVDRMVMLGIMPVNETLPIDKGLDVWQNFGTHSFFERREAGFFNLGGAGSCVVDDTVYNMGYKDCIYIARGAEKVFFMSDNSENPARFYGVSAPAHCTYETKLITIDAAAKKPLSTPETANQRVINQFIHPDVLKTCQLSMGLTELSPGSVWNTMPSHTHERRMEVYTYFEIPEGNIVFHMMGEAQETRHITMRNFDAVISPSWSIHSGCGTASYSFIWTMGGENLAFDDMDVLPTESLQ